MSFRAPEGVRSFFKWMNEATGGSEFVPGKVDFNPDKFWYGFEYYIGGRRSLHERLARVETHTR